MGTAALILMSVFTHLKESGWIRDLRGSVEVLLVDSVTLALEERTSAPATPAAPAAPPAATGVASPPAAGAGPDSMD